jgi:TATA-binding protein-associated factor Taf7
MLINKALAQETQRSHLADEDIRRTQNYETMRHNVAQESYNYSALAETSRHNRAGEIVTAQTLAENTRHNLASESLSRSAQEESIRHNKATEVETHRTNVANETIKEQSNLIAAARSDWEKDVAEVKNLIAKESNSLTRQKLEQDLTKINNDYEIAMRNLKQQWRTAVMNNNTALAGQLTNAVVTLTNGSGKNIYYWVKALDDGTKIFVPRSTRRY